MNRNREQLQEAMNIVNTYKDNPLIQKYYEALHIVLEAYNETNRSDEKGNFYMFDDKYDYYIVEPTEIITMEKGNYMFKKTGYDAFACDKETGIPKLYFCRSLCNYNLEQIKNVIRNHINETQNDEVENEKED